MDAAPSPRAELTASWSTPAVIVGFAVGFAFRLLPRRMRFRTAVRLAQAIAPAAVRLLALVGYSGVVVGPINATIRVLCRAMVVTRTPFDPETRYDGPEVPPESIVVSGHFPLNALVSRHLFDHGRLPVAIKSQPLADPYFWGTEVRDHALAPSPTVLLKVRSTLAAGRPVLMDIDAAREGPRRVSVSTTIGEAAAVTAPFELAARLGVPLYFACGRAERKGLPLIVVRKIETIEEFIALFSEQAEGLV